MKEVESGAKKKSHNFSNETMASSSQEILYGLNPYGEKFPLYTKDLIQDLCVQLDLNYSIYENDLEGLIKILAEQIKLKKDKDFYKEKFLNLIALIGEATNKKIGSRWIMKLSEHDKVTWNTLLAIRDEQVVFHTYLYEDIFLGDSDNEYLIEDVYQTTLDIININILKK